MVYESGMDVVRVLFRRGGKGIFFIRNFCLEGTCHCEGSKAGRLYRKEFL